MATVADVQASLSTLSTAFNALTAQAKVVYDAAKANAGGASPADLDAIKATIDADTASVNGALATITAP